MIGVQIAYLVIVGGLAMVTLDAFGAVTTKMLGINYLWFLPISVAGYLALGFVGTRWTDIAVATASASGAAFIDGTLGAWVTWRLGVIPMSRDQYKSMLGCSIPAGMVLMAFVAYAGGRWAA